MTKKKINKTKLFRRSILLVLLLGIIGIYFSNRYVKQYGFEGLGDFITNYRHNTQLANLVEPEVMQINIADSDYEFLKIKRQEALDRGIQINEGDNYIPCAIDFKGETTEGEMRLKGHMTDHLEGKKWSFRIKSNEEILGMYRFTLQNPATRNYAYEWVYHKLLEKENIIHLYYDFLQLKLNGEDLGIYAVEEHFGQHVVERNDRPAGAILRWNPELYWEWRIDELNGLYLDEQYSAYSSSFVEPYDKGTIKKDSALVETYIKGASLLEAFRRGEKKSSEVFDLEKMAGFHAIIDLVGGYHSLDWSDVKFYYNSNTGLIEPVGYESFSVRKTERIAGQRTPNDFDPIQLNYHDQLFADPIFFAAYIAAIERICNEAYFDEFIQEISPELDKKRGILAHEWPYLKFTFDGYFENIELIRHNIELPKPFHAFLEGYADSTVYLSITPVSDFPIEILALEIDGKNEYPLDSIFVLPPKPRNTFAHYFSLNFKIDLKPKNLKLKARIPGSKTVFEVEVSELPDYRTAAIEDIELVEDAKLLPPDRFISFNDSVYYLKESEIIFNDETVLLPQGKILRLFPHQKLIFNGYSELVVEGKLELYGGSDEEITIESNSELTPLTLNHGELIGGNILFTGSGHDIIHSVQSKIKLENVWIYDFKGNFILSSESEIFLQGGGSGNLKTMGIMDRCLVKINNMTFINGTTLIYSLGSDIDLTNSAVERFEKIVDLDYSSDFRSWSSKFEHIDLFGNLNNASYVHTYACEISDCSLGFEVDLNSKMAGKSSFVLYKTQTEGIKKLEKKSS